MHEHQGDDDIRVFCVKIKNYTRDGVFMNDGFSGWIFRNLPNMRFEGQCMKKSLKVDPMCRQITV